MKLKTLIKGIRECQLKGKDVAISGLADDSRLVTPGHLFFARKGTNADGAQFVEDAVNTGAAAVVCDLYNPFLNVPQIICKDVKQVEAQLASKFYKNPSKKLFVAAVTGTNGKTTSCYLMRALLKPDGGCGLMGSIEWIAGDKVYPSQLTTPGLLTVQKLFSEMVDAGDKNVVLEASSHGLDQRRLEGVDIDVALFTNFSQEHLDYHKNMEDYLKAKCKLFSMAKVAVLNQDVEEFEKIKKACRGEVLTYSTKKEADLTATDIQSDDRGIAFTAHYKGKSALFTLPLFGAFNVENALGAIGVALTKGISIETCSLRLSAFHPVPGRMEKVCEGVFVDFAHKPEALRHSLQTARTLTKKRVIVVFGCGGDRDRGKRAVMGKIAAALADLVVVTSDNPRTENPQSIINQVLSEIRQLDSVFQKEDRKEAIAFALSKAEKGDVVLIAGKGHEKKQIFKNQTVDFDDVKIAFSLCSS